MFDNSTDGRIDFFELRELNRRFPNLLYPAFRLQESMMRCTLGMQWWQLKRHAMVEARREERMASERELARQMKASQKLRNHHVRVKMGFFAYYLTPWNRQVYVDIISNEEEEEAAESGGSAGTGEFESAKNIRGDIGEVDVHKMFGKIDQEAEDIKALTGDEASQTQAQKRQLAKAAVKAQKSEKNSPLKTKTQRQREERRAERRAKRRAEREAEEGE